MPDRIFYTANRFETVLSQPVGPTDTSFPVQSTSGMPVPCYLVFNPEDDNSVEIVFVDGPSDASTFRTSQLANRYLEGSAASSNLSHPAGTKVAALTVAQMFEDIHDRISSRMRVDEHTVEAHENLALPHHSLSGRDADDHPQYLNSARHTKALHDQLGISHGSLSGLGNDDHPQYLNSARHTRGIHEALGISHSSLSNLSTGDPHTQYLRKAAMGDGVASQQIRSTTDQEFHSTFSTLSSATISLPSGWGSMMVLASGFLRWSTRNWTPVRSQFRVETAGSTVLMPTVTDSVTPLHNAGVFEHSVIPLSFLVASTSSNIDIRFVGARSNIGQGSGGQTICNHRELQVLKFRLG